MISCDQQGPAHLAGGIEEPTHAAINAANGLHGGVHIAGVPNHVGVGVVDHNKGVDPLADRCHAPIGEGVSRHVRGLVVGGHLGGGDQMAILTRKRLFHPAVEEIGDVGIFLGFSRAELAQAGAGDHLAQQVIKRFRWEGNGHRQGFVVLREGDHRQGVNVLALEALEVAVHQGSRELPDAVGAEVEQHQGIAGADLLWPKANWLEEFITGAGLMGRLHHLQRRLVADAVVFGQQPVSPLHPLPAVVAIHGPVAAAECCQPANTGSLDLLLQRGEIAGGAIGWGIAPIGDAVDAHLSDALLLGPLQETGNVIDVAVNTTIGEQAKQVQAAAGLLEIAGEGAECWIAGQGAIGNGLADAHQLLTNHPT